MPGRSTMPTLRPSGSSAIPVCCSTVTPGKLATFWRSPVRRLKRVVLPELGGPTSATGEIGHLLAQSGETIEEGGLAGTGRPHQRHRADRRRAQQFRYRRTTTTMATAAIAHAILGVLRGLWGRSEEHT